MKRKLSVFIMIIVSSFFFTSTSFAVESIKKIDSSLFINGEKFNLGVPLKEIDGNITVPLKPFIEKFGLKLIWNQDFKGYRINAYRKVLLLKPNRRVMETVDIISSNYNENGEFDGKIKRMPLPLVIQGNYQYISLRWICEQLGLVFSIRNNSYFVTGEPIDDKEYLHAAYTNLYNKYADYADAYFLSDFNTFLTYEFISEVNRNFDHIEDTKVLALMGKTVWLNDNDTATDINTNAVISIPRFSEIKIIDEYDLFACIILYKNKKYYLSNYIAYTYLDADPQKEYKWSTKIWNEIKSRNVSIGMNTAQANLSWGLPDRINRTTTSNGTFEQWAYPHRKYLYFLNGKLTAIQN